MVVAGLFISGCHKRYQRHAKDLGHVKLVVERPAGATVESADADVAIPADETGVVETVAEVAMDVATVVLAAKAQKKLDRATSPGETRAAMAAGLLQSVDNESLPYKVGEKGRSRLVISIENYGLDASSGMPMAFVSTRTSIFNKQGKPVYRAMETCYRSIGPDAQIPIDSVDNLLAMKALSELGAKRMAKIMESLTEQCAEEIAAELVLHL